VPPAPAPEQQPLLGPGERLLPGDRGKTRVAVSVDATIELVEVASLGWFVFSAVCIFFGFMYHGHEIQIWSLLILGGFLIAVYIRMHVRNASSDTTLPHLKAKAWKDALFGSWVLVSVLFGAAVGIFAYEWRIRNYWLSQELEARANVLPSEPAGAYLNVGEIVFADEARIDASKTIGYKDGRVYCVAPIAGDIPLDKVQFWAAGTDCCGARGNFQCDDAWDLQARSGIVLRDHQGAFVKDKRPYFMKAVDMAKATYAVASAEEPIFVQWIADPDKVELNIWKKGMGFILCAIIIAPLLCGLSACAMSPIVQSALDEQAYG